MLSAGDRLPSKRGTTVDSLEVKSLPAPRVFPVSCVGAAAGAAETGSTA